jgi:hypothetical protein
MHPLIHHSSLFFLKFSKEQNQIDSMFYLVLIMNYSFIFKHFVQAWELVSKMLLNLILGFNFPNHLHLQILRPFFHISTNQLICIISLPLT